MSGLCRRTPDGGNQSTFGIFENRKATSRGDDLVETRPAHFKTRAEKKISLPGTDARHVRLEEIQTEKGKQPHGGSPAKTKKGEGKIQKRKGELTLRDNQCSGAVENTQAKQARKKRKQREKRRQARKRAFSCVISTRLLFVDLLDPRGRCLSSGFGKKNNMPRRRSVLRLLPRLWALKRTRLGRASASLFGFQQAASATQREGEEGRDRETAKQTGK